MTAWRRFRPAVRVALGLGMLAAVLAAASPDGQPADLFLPVSVVIGLVVGAAGYGRLQQSSSACHRRLDELTGPGGPLFGHAARLALIETALTDIRIELARLQHSRDRGHDGDE